MKLTNEDRLNLIDSLSKTQFWELLPIELNEDQIGLDRKRWEDILQRLIDEK
tara:strand:- start:3575 stop:3730 length:156 start_codon:yes stop_codon:yes gene_type:complete